MRGRPRGNGHIVTRASRSLLPRVLTPAALIRLALPWLGVFLLPLLDGLLAPPAAAPLLLGALAVTVAVIVVAAFGVVEQAERLAHRMGDPYGSLILTLSIVVIEVVLIMAVMLGPGEHATIARDSVMAVSLIILGLVLGLAFLLGARKESLSHNRTGAGIYVAMIAVLTTLAFALPATAGDNGALLPGQVLPVAAITALLYATFLWRQLSVQAGDFREVMEQGGKPGHRFDSSACRESAQSARTLATAEKPPTTGASLHAPIAAILREHRSEILLRLTVLVATMVPIVLLSHDLASLLDDGIERLGAPPALSGALIACIVFTPEAITAVRAGLAGEGQRVLNLCLGALVSTVGLTIPAVLVIGYATGSPVVLAETPAMLTILLAAIALTAITTAAPRITATHGALHLTVFAVYGLLLFTN